LKETRIRDELSPIMSPSPSRLDLDLDRPVEHLLTHTYEFADRNRTA
jgi:hypothetical protein